MKILTVVGARPQFIKSAVVSRAIGAHNSMNSDPQAAINEITVHTGQHFDERMSDIFFEEMKIPSPHYNLQINSLSHGAMTGRMLEKLESILLQERPDCVVVYGDTNSTLAGALAAKKLHIKVAHVEAGMRSFNMNMPEEINRVLTDRISDILCCSTASSANNLKLEGLERNNSTIIITGDVMLDAALFYGDISSEKSTIVKALGVQGKDFVLCTVHRAENTDDPTRLKSILEALNSISREMRVVFPMHPRTRKLLSSCQTTLEFDQIDPVGYFDMIELLKHSRLVVTDSGGLQKEAYFFEKPCVTLRDETEWVELVEHGANVLAGSDSERIFSSYREMRRIQPNFSKDFYGGGQAGRRIVAAIHKGLLPISER